MNDTFLSGLLQLIWAKQFILEYYFFDDILLMIQKLNQNYSLPHRTRSCELLSLLSVITAFRRCVLYPRID